MLLMKLNKYLPFAFIYFFVNSVALPFGLTYTALLAPLFYTWVLLVRKKEILLPFLVLLLPFIILHAISGVELKTYAISLVNLLAVYIFCQAAYTFFKVCKDPEVIFRRILVVNSIFCLLAIFIYFTPYAEWLWMEQTISTGIEQFMRLKLLTYEPSYYALIFIPIFFFYLLQYFFRQNTIPAPLLLPMLFIPYILSFSIGVIGAGLIAGLLTYLIHLRPLTKKRRILNSIVNTGAIVVSGMTVGILFFRDNPLFSRLANVFSGRDSSGKGRTIDAFIIAEKILKQTNEYWGAGIGQIKLVGDNIIRNYYLYDASFTVAIPNAVAETLAIFGWAGLSLRLLIEISLFFITKVWTNYYRLLLFFFMFVYQFTGSFITNVAEYVIWILAFTNVFRQFDLKAENEQAPVEAISLPTT
jgi:hypothetical protein